MWANKRIVGAELSVAKMPALQKIVIYAEYTWLVSVDITPSDGELYVESLHASALGVPELTASAGELMSKFHVKSH